MVLKPGTVKPFRNREATCLYTEFSIHFYFIDK